MAHRRKKSVAKHTFVLLQSGAALPGVSAVALRESLFTIAGTSAASWAATHYCCALAVAAGAVFQGGWFFA